MKHVYDEDILSCLKNMLSLLKEAGKQKAGVLYIESALVYLLGAVDNRNKQEFLEIIETAFSEETGDRTMVTVSEFYEA